MVHLAPYAIYAHLDHLVNGDAFVVVETTVENHSAQDTELWVCLTAQPEQGGLIAEGRIKVYIPAGERAIARTQITLENAKIWDVNEPNLYKITAAITNGETVIDETDTLFGVRTITMDAKNGFMLNGRPL